MATKTTTTELRKMQAPDLLREVSAKRMEIAKVRMGVEMRQEKDTAKLSRDKKDLARLLTIARENSLKTSQKSATIPLSKSAKSRTSSSPKQ